MKKNLLIFTVLALFCSVSSANCSQDCQKMFKPNDIKCEKQCQKECQKNECKNTCDKKECDKKNIANEELCDKYKIENDDEYCIYNQCYFDKHYRKMKKTLCLTRRQENCIDNIYRNFKTDMEKCCAKYRNEKNKLLEMIECDNDCYKEQVKVLKEIRKNVKEKCKDYREEVVDQLCKNQRSDFKKFQKEEKKKMKKIVKYGAIYKFPCVNCCKK